jgi:hypothetical protein
MDKFCITLIVGPPRSIDQCFVTKPKRRSLARGRFCANTTRDKWCQQSQHRASHWKYEVSPIASGPGAFPPRDRLNITRLAGPPPGPNNSSGQNPSTALVV